MTFSPKKSAPKQNTWRDYQKGLQRHTKRRSRRRSAFGKLALLLIIVGAAGYGLLHWAQALLPVGQPTADGTVAERITPRAGDAKLKPAAALDRKAFLNIRNPDFTTQIDGQTYRVETSIDPRLQESLLAKVEEVTNRERYRSRFIGIVVMKADTGRILSMVSFDKHDPTHNTCVDNQFPAASIFKIVTAAAAIDAHGLTADSPLDYTGPRHTLYRGQLKDAARRYTHTLSLEDSFAQSVNPVFGKLGAGLVGKAAMEEFAGRFGFNRAIDFDIAVEPSRFAVGDDPFHQAEIASGFNTQTTISPLHGAMIASTVLNGGRMKVPTMVERIIGPENRIVYERAEQPSCRVISERSSGALQRMMRATVASGTAHKVFKGLHRNVTLRDLDIGGKTGSINNNPRFDWFVGFAENPRTHEAIIVSAVVAHEQYIGKKAGEYAKMAMESFFSRDSAMAVPAGKPPAARFKG